MADIVIGNPGSYTGTPGIDTFIFLGGRSQYSVTDHFPIDGRHLVDVYGPGGPYSITDGEYLKFNDQIVPLAIQTSVQAVGNGSVKHEYDAHGDLFRATYSYYDGSTVKYDYDVLSQFAWTKVVTTYGPGYGEDWAPQDRKIVYYNDDGTSVVYQHNSYTSYEVDYSYSSTMQTYFNALGQREKVIDTEFHFDSGDINRSNRLLK